MTESAPETVPAAPTGTEPDTGADLTAEVEKWKALAQKHEARAKANAQAAKELETVKAASMSEVERAVAEAEKRGEAQALGRIGHRLVESELRLAAAGRTLTTDALLSFDRAKFLTDDGDVNREELTKWVEQHSVTAAPTPPRFGAVDQGVRTTTPPADKDERAVARTLFGTPRT